MKVTIVSSEGLLFDGKVEQLIVPAVHGQASFFGSISPQVMALKEGDITLVLDNNNCDDSQSVFSVLSGYLHLAYEKAHIILNT